MAVGTGFTGMGAGMHKITHGLPVITSVLQCMRYVSTGVNVLSRASPFFMINAPVAGSTDVSKDVSLGNHTIFCICASRITFMPVQPEK
jgi:hypothetical protein